MLLSKWRPWTKIISLNFRNHGKKPRSTLTNNPYPTDPFKIWKLPNPSNGIDELHKLCRSPYFEALKL